MIKVATDPGLTVAALLDNAIGELDHDQVVRDIDAVFGDTSWTCEEVLEMFGWMRGTFGRLATHNPDAARSVVADLRTSVFLRYRPRESESHSLRGAASKSRVNVRTSLARSKGPARGARR